MKDIRFTRIRDVKSPVRETAEAAGIDFFVPNYTEQFEADFREKNPNIVLEFSENSTKMTIVLKPGERALIPSGVKTWMEAGTALIGANKSGVASKKGLVYGAHVIDSDYAGELHINVINTGNESVRIDTGEKLIQFIHTPILLSPLTEVDDIEFERLHSESVRGTGGFGSTGTK